MNPAPRRRCAVSGRRATARTASPEASNEGQPARFLRFAAVVRSTPKIDNGSGEDRGMNRLEKIPLLTFLLAASCSSSRNDKSGRSNHESQSSATADADGEEAAATQHPTRKAVAPRITRPNVVFVVIDTVRPDFLGMYGAKNEIAPFLGTMAKKSAVFENAFSTSSWTAPATASIFTGLYPPEHSVVQGFRAHRAWVAKLEKEGSAEFEVNQMPTDMRTLPEIFKQAGYRTFGLAANINIGEAIGFNRGFDTFYKDVKAPAETMYDKVAELRPKIVGNGPFFLYLHFNDAHNPYNKRDPYYQASSDPEEDARARYRSEISYLDGFLKKVWQLEGISQNTVLAVVSDHGEEFWEHGDAEHGPTLYIELNHVVMMLYGPETGLKPTRISENVSLIDIVPTLASLIGAQLKTDRAGVSLMPLLAQNSSAEALRKQLRDRCLFAHRMFSTIRNAAVWSATCGPLKLIDWWGDRNKLFDHRTDPGEHRDISDEHAETTAQLSSRLENFKKRMSGRERSTSTTEIALDKTLVERLKTLGYVE